MNDVREQTIVSMVLINLQVKRRLTDERDPVLWPSTQLLGLCLFISSRHTRGVLTGRPSHVLQHARI